MKNSALTTEAFVRLALETEVAFHRGLIDYSGMQLSFNEAEDTATVVFDNESATVTKALFFQELKNAQARLDLLVDQQEIEEVEA